MKNKVFGYVLRPKVQGNGNHYIRRNRLGFHDRNVVIGNATVIKKESNALRLAGQLDAEAVPIYSNPRRVGSDALTPKSWWLIRLEGRGPVEVLAHRVTWHKNWKRTRDGRHPIFADGDTVLALPKRAKVVSVDKAPLGLLESVA